MQSTGVFPALNSGMRGRNPVNSRMGVPSVTRSVAAAQSPNPIGPQKRRKQLVMPQPKVASNPLGLMAANPNIAAMVGRALNIKG